MRYCIEISSVAEAEADNAFLRLSQFISPDKARQWYDGLLRAIKSLSQMPKRCPIARENKYFSQEIRQLLYGRGRDSYRILFTIVEGEEYPQFAFSTSDTLHNKLSVKARNLMKLNISWQCALLVQHYTGKKLTTGENNGLVTLR